MSQTGTYSEIPEAPWADPTGPGDLEGATDWAYGLDSDVTVQQVTANVLRRLSKGRSVS